MEPLTGVDYDVLGVIHALIRSIDQHATGQVERDCVREELVQIGISVGTGWKTFVLRVAHPSDSPVLEQA